jgi:hypothetical protein
MHPWMVFTPEVNYTTITSGAGPGPTVEHARYHHACAPTRACSGTRPGPNAAHRPASS